LKYSKFVVLAVVALNAAFAVAVFYLSYRDHEVPDSLIVAWFGFTTGELWVLASIRKAKVKKEGERQDDKSVD
jgi:Na+-transporting NADH:ubiquinone oxidoreductase subunit NqrE